MPNSIFGKALEQYVAGQRTLADLYTLAVQLGINTKTAERLIIRAKEQREAERENALMVKPAGNVMKLGCWDV